MSHIDDMVCFLCVSVCSDPLLQETRTVELRNLMEQHKFIKELDDDFPRKAELLRELTSKIVASPKDSFWDEHQCSICLSGFDPEHKNCARLPSTRQPMYTRIFFGFFPK